MARAFDWQSRGHRFDSDMLHEEVEDVEGVEKVERKGILIEECERGKQQLALFFFGLCYSGMFGTD